MIHIACIDITPLTPGDYQRLYAGASPERRRRSDRYRREEDKLRCVAADALLRYAVRETLDITDFTVIQDANGKPCIENAEQFHFNLSHSGPWVVIAWGGSPVGIDVQQIRMDSGKELIARRHFTAGEQAYVFAAQGECRAERFFTVWTAKESWLKYLGTGIRQPLDSFDVLSEDLPLSSWRLGDCVLTLCAREEHCPPRVLTLEHLP